ncbi:hypothetical protein MRX96_059432 [Rhipicephalus microplus]
MTCIITPGLDTVGARKRRMRSDGTKVLQASSNGSSVMSDRVSGRSERCPEYGGVPLGVPQEPVEAARFLALNVASLPTIRDPKVTMLISLLMDHDTLTEPAVGTLLCTVSGSETSPGFADCLAKTRDTLHSLTLRPAGFYSAPDCKMIVFQEVDVVSSSRLCRGT